MYEDKSEYSPTFHTQGQGDGDDVETIVPSTFSVTGALCPIMEMEYNDRIDPSGTGYEIVRDLGTDLLVEVHMGRFRLSDLEKMPPELTLSEQELKEAENRIRTARGLGLQMRERVQEIARTEWDAKIQVQSEEVFTVELRSEHFPDLAGLLNGYLDGIAGIIQQDD